ncbi:glycine cleavage H protein [Agaricus bisporus var. bisporus H97]|uniref:glycine cleavage H protein n=1 Tax=Agaricus bisporus var. bisporus (strain H97 / ATCC MYA-4626 / FGSC 10389) TaxID=936046 RepID=UPI00029F776C|nr:glycine cleavage H protein [Agaricus bisporus var. bisporus H97]EKV52027.1 glycine cleavage H protein [Agaricus bisporus var. bisporus H97]
MQSLLRTATRSRPALSGLWRTNLGRATYPNLGIRTLITKRYSKDHETISYDDQTGIGTLTITDHAQSTLGDVVFVELPAEGKEVEQGETVGAVESVKAASDIYSPVSGVVVEVNRALADQPGKLNKSAEQDGWLCKIKLSDPSEVEKLLTKEAYDSYINNSESA